MTEDVTEDVTEGLPEDVTEGCAPRVTERQPKALMLTPLARQRRTFVFVFIKQIFGHVFGHVFAVPPREGEPPATYELDFVEVEDRLPEDVLKARLQKEAVAVPKFAPGGPWQEATRTLRELHDWVHQENSAYASIRLLEERKPLDPALLKSY